MENLSGSQEKALLLRISEGDEVAFREIFNQYTGKIYSFAIYLTRSDFLAEEITQEVFLRIWTNRPKLAKVDYFQAYLKTIAKNIFSTHLRRLALEKGILKDISLNIQPGANTTEMTVDNRELQQILQTAIQQLPPQQKNVYILGRQQNLSYEEIAGTLNISVHTVKEHMHKALSSIRIYVHDKSGLPALVAFLILFKK
jgi:RNA polymerase sigma-70 factor (family 1)